MLALAGVATISTIAWMSWRALRLAGGSPDRLVAELRLAQLVAAVLICSSAADIGLAALRPDVPYAGLAVASAVGFLVVAITAAWRDPREALTTLAIAFLVRVLVDLALMPGQIFEGLAPGWFASGRAVHALIAGACCYLPLLRREVH